MGPSVRSACMRSYSCWRCSICIDSVPAPDSTGLDDRAEALGKRRADADGDVPGAGQVGRLGLKHFCPIGGQVARLVVGQRFVAAGDRDPVWVGVVDAVTAGLEQAYLAAERGRL